MKHQKRIGRGIGSGKGKTGGRGSKGQLARGKMPLTFTGAGLPLYKKLPLRRGLGNRPVSGKPNIISLSQLQVFKSGEKVNLNSLFEKGIIVDLKRGAKILDIGEAKLKLEVNIPASKKAKEKIEKAGGTINV